MQRRTPLLLLCSLPLILNACAAKQPEANNDEAIWKEKIEQRLDSVTDKSDEVVKLRARIALLESENKREFTFAQNELAALNTQVAALKDELKKLKTSRTKAKPKSKPKATPKPEPKAVAEPVAKNNPEPALIPKPTSKNESQRAKQAYYDAYFALKNGDYFEASLAFRNFLRDFPATKLADEAKYWYGESLLAQGEAGKALVVFQDIIKAAPYTARHAAAMLKAGMIYERQRNRDQALALYGRLIRQHPASSEAETARSRLKENSKQG